MTHKWAMNEQNAQAQKKLYNKIRSIKSKLQQQHSLWFCQYSHSILDNCELKNVKFQNLLKPIHHYRAEILKFSKMHQKTLSHLKYLRELQLILCENYNIFPAHQKTLVTTVTCRCLVWIFGVKFLKLS